MMGVMRGPKPKPSDPAKSHRPKPHPVLVGGHPELEEFGEPPEHLPADAKRFWVQHVPWLTSAGLLDRVDVAALEMLATTYARFWQAKRVVESDGLFVEGSRGQAKISPAVRIEAESRDAFLRLAEQFGLSPLARIRLGLADLTRKSLQQDLLSSLGPVELTVVEGSVVDDGPPAA
jgi:P27 family predicted phage terminase small subunit